MDAKLVMNKKKLCFALLVILSAVLIVGCTGISQTHLDLHKAENEALDLYGKSLDSHLDAINNHAEILEEQRKKIKALETQTKAWKAENNE